MVLDIDINLKNNVVTMVEELDTGLKQRKSMLLDEFLQNYVSALKEKSDLEEYIFLPPGTVEYAKNINSVVYSVHTLNYREYYGLSDETMDDYLIVLTMSQDGKVLINYNVYRTKGAFNKIISRFELIEESNDSVNVSDEVGAIRMIADSVKRKDVSIADREILRYSQIKK